MRRPEAVRSQSRLVARRQRPALGAIRRISRFRCMRNPIVFDVSPLRSADSNPEEANEADGRYHWTTPTRARMTRDRTVLVGFLYCLAFATSAIAQPARV